MTIVSIILCALGLVGIAIGLDQLDHYPWESELNLIYPSLAVVDSVGTIHIVDSASRRIVSTDQQGRLLNLHHGGQRQQGFYYAHDLDLDSLDRLYVYNLIPEEGNVAQTKAIQIVRYSHDGNFDRIIFEQISTNQSREHRQNHRRYFPDLFSLSVLGETIYYFINDGKSLSLNKMDLEGNDKSKVLELPYLDGLVAIDGIEKGLIFAVTRDGSIFRLDENLIWQVLSIDHTVRPWDIKLGSDSRIWFLDLVKREIRTIEKPLTAKVVSVAFKMGLNEGSPGDRFFLGKDNSLTLTEKLGQSIIFQDSQGQRLKLQTLVRDPNEMLRTMIAWFGVMLTAIAIVLAVFAFVTMLFKKRIPIVLIHLLLLVPFIGLAQAFYFSQLYQILQVRYQAQVKISLSAAALLATKAVDAQALDRLQKPQDFSGASYSAVAERGSQLADLLDNSLLSYFSIYRMQDQRVYVVYTSSRSFGVMYPNDIFPKAALESFQKNSIVFTEYDDEFGRYKAAFASVLNGQGKVVGVVETGLFADFTKDFEDLNLDEVQTFVILNAIFFLGLFVCVTLMMLRSLNPVRRIARELAAGALDIAVDSRETEQVSQTRKGFSSKAARLRTDLKQLNQATKASARFVPQQFLHLLGIEDSATLNLGFHKSQTMAVLCSSVANFKKIGSHLSPQAVIDFLNAYLKIVSPCLQKHHGFIDRHMGDSYVALFPRKAMDAVLAVFQICQEVLSYSHRSGFPGSEELSLSFSIDYGSLRLGIVGESNRMESRAISDTVKLTEVLNQLSQIYHVRLVSTEDTLYQVLSELGFHAKRFADQRRYEDLKKLYPKLTFRRLDLIKFSPLKKAVSVIEICGTDRFPSHLGIDWIVRYEAAFDAWLLGDFRIASELFEKLYNEAPDDLVVKRQLERTSKLLKEGMPETWTPEVEVSEI